MATGLLSACDGIGLRGTGLEQLLFGRAPRPTVAILPSSEYQLQPVSFRFSPPELTLGRLGQIRERMDALPQRSWSCVPYARAVSGIEIRGDAWRWWQNAAGRYGRGDVPEVGAVLVLSRTGRLRRGHVAVVTDIVDDREIVVTHANWIRRGRVVPEMHVRDVSAENDWSQTRWFYPPTGTWGSVYPASGFIYPEPIPDGQPIVAMSDEDPDPPPALVLADVMPEAEPQLRLSDPPDIQAVQVAELPELNLTMLGSY